MPKNGEISDQVIEDILALASRVPDHRRVVPWRFLVITGDKRQIISKQWNELRQESDGAMDTVSWLLRAPVIISVVFSPDMQHKTPPFEQTLTTGAVCMNVLHAAHGYGLSAAWISEWPMFNNDAWKTLGLAPHERPAGFIYLSSNTTQLAERKRPGSGIITYA